MLKCRILRKVVKYFQHRVFQNGMYFELISRIQLCTPVDLHVLYVNLRKLIIKCVCLAWALQI